MFLCLGGSNCQAIINRSKVTHRDIKILTDIDVKDSICAICFNPVKQKYEILDCDHEFCTDCLGEWKRKHR